MLCCCTLGLVGSCSDESGDGVTPADLRQRLPDIDLLKIPIPSQDNGEETASGVVAAQLRRVETQLGALDLLDAYLTEGGSIDRDVAIVVAIEDPPRVAGPTTRYRRPASRLDVESATDHRLFYLQTEVSGRFDPDNAISERALLLDGSTVRATALGHRSSVSRATGVASPQRGYMRAHLNRRAQEVDPLSDAIQIDYDLDAEQQSVHLLYFDRSSQADEDRPHALWSTYSVESGQRFLYYSVSRGNRQVYAWLAQRTRDNQLIVWRGDGTLWACYDSSGAEVGNETAPELCENLQAFPNPPGGAGWPGLPAGVPR